MREGIHPTYYPEAQVICGCGNTFTTGSTQEVIRTDVCSDCHPFYTGEQRIVDSAGQVERFMKRLEVREEITHEQREQERARREAERRIREKRKQERLRRAGLKEISDSMATPGRPSREAEQAAAELQGPEGGEPGSAREGQPGEAGEEPESSEGKTAQRASGGSEGKPRSGGGGKRSAPAREVAAEDHEGDAE